MSLLEIRNLQVRVDDREILKGLDLTVNEGEVHAIMGPNGSGKSTLAHVLSGKPGYEVTGGSVTFEGADLLELSPRRARGARHLPRLPVSAGNPRRRHHDVPAHRAQRPAQDARRDGAVDAGIHEAGARGGGASSRSTRTCCGGRSMSAFPAARRSATRSCRWRCSSPSSRCSTRPIPASTSMPSRWSPTASTGCARPTGR